MIVRQQYGINAGEFFKLDGGVGNTLCGDAWAEMDVVAVVEEVWVGHEADAVPF